MLKDFAFTLQFLISKMSKMFKKITLSVLTLFCFTSLLVAQVGIGTTTPADGAILDVDSDSGGIMIPRVALTATNVVAPIISTLPTPEVGLLVYNTNTAGTAPNNVTPGFYFWNGIWERITSGASTDWSLTGNAGTTPGTAAGENFIGTSDAEDFVIATNGAERMRVDASGNVGINTAPTERLHIDGNLQLDGAFMPGGISGNTDQILISKGVGNNPEWGPGFLNVGAISNIGKYFVGPLNIEDGFYYTIPVADPNMTIDTVVSCNFVGALPSGPGPAWGFDFTLFSEVRAGQVVFHILNVSGFDISNLQIVYVAHYN
tara:strand:+ start:2691 stop:3644 length:954 start_codon:yes stop_codon:yes gene_type:complete